MNNRWYKLLPCLSVLALAFILSFVQIDDLDIWWHLKCGELLVREGRILRQDIFSYTANGMPWVDGYLPAQAVMYIFWWLAGPAGATLFNVLLVVTAYALALAMSNRSRVGFGAALFAAIPAIVLPRIVMIPRPALLSPIFALIALQLLENHRKYGDMYLLRVPIFQGNSGTQSLFLRKNKVMPPNYWLIPLTALWANCHPGFLLAPFLTSVYLFIPWIGRLINKSGKNTKKSEKKSKAPSTEIMGIREKELLRTLALQIMATFFNPYGYKIYYSTFSLLQNLGYRKIIFEWMPLKSTAPVPMDTFLSFYILAAIGLACILYAGRRGRPEHIFLFVFLAVSSFYARRNIILFGPLSLPLISWIMSGISGTPYLIRGELSKVSPKLRPLFPARIRDAMIKSGVGLITVSALFLFWFSATDRFYFYTLNLRNTGFGVQPLVFPEGAADLLMREKVSGNLFHSYDMGGYLLFRLYPQYKVFIDGRIYPYSLDIFKMGEAAFFSFPAFEDVEKKYNIGAALMHMDVMQTWQQIWAFMQSPNWAAVQADSSFILFLRRGPGNDPLIKKYEIDLVRHPPTLETPAPGREFHLWDSAELASGPVRWALFYKTIGKPELAAEVLRPALNYRPLDPVFATWLGGLLMQAGKPEEAFKVLQEALIRDHDDIMALRYLADYYIYKKDFDQVEQILVRVTRLDPNTAEVWNTLGEIAFNRQDYGRAANLFRHAANARPDQRKYWEKLGISLQFFDTDEAQKVFQRASQISTKEAELPGDVTRIREQIMKMHR